MTPARLKSQIDKDASWLPLAFVIAALAVLLVTPILVNWRISRLRSEVDERTHARLLLNDLEAAGATEALIAAQPPRPAGGTDTVAQQLAETVVTGATADERQLDSLLRTASPESRADLASIADVERAWRTARALDTGALRHALADSNALRLYALAEQLDARLSVRVEQARAESRRLQTIDVIAAIVLTPLALLSVIAVFIAGRRSRTLARRLDAERDALAQSIEARAALMRGITHDVKNPLGAAAGYADLLLEGIPGGPLSAENANVVRRIRKLLTESVGTISSLLQIAHNRGQSELGMTFVSVDVGALVREVVDDYRAAASERRQRLDLDVTTKATVAVTDGGHVRHVLGNLLSNAVKYAPEQGHIRVRVGDDARGDALCIEVCDDGPGVPQGLRDRVFEEFFRVESRTPGHGVGLSISRRLARMLGGDITLADAPEGGAMFVFRLPRRRAAVAA